jgi:hypothetical protein
VGWESTYLNQAENTGILLIHLALEVDGTGAGWGGVCGGGEGGGRGRGRKRCWVGHPVALY